MNGQSDNATVPSRTTVRIPTTSGDELEAWLYLPEGDGPHPAVVIAHGIGAIKAGGLAPFAERFCREGFAAAVFDYRQWGCSSCWTARRAGTGCSFRLRLFSIQ